MRKRHIKTHAYPRVGLVGNPSDGYHGRTIAFTFRNFKAEILLGEDSSRISFVNRESNFDSVSDLCSHIRLHGYYGGIRLLKAAIKRFHDYCLEASIPADFEKKFKVTYSSNIPQQVGLAGSSAIITATFRALMAFYEVSIAPEILPNLIREVETQELAIPAGLQDRVVQVYDCLVYMDFNQEYMATHGHGLYEPINLAGEWPPFYIAWRADSSEGTEEALLEGDHDTLFDCINQNFDRRRSLYETLRIRMKPEHLEMVTLARECGASAKFAGSGGAIVGTYRNQKDFKRLRDHLLQKGIHVIQPLFKEEPQL
jgi:glucuronokinase